MTARRQTGFSLLEVLVAFAILALSLGVLMQIFSSGARGAFLSEQYSTALGIAESRLAEAGRIDADKLEDSGKVGDVYQWKVTAKAIEEDVFTDISTRVKAYELTVQVSWEEGEKRRSVELSTLRLVPKQ